MTHQAAVKDLQRIIALANKVQAQYSDEQMHYLLGSIRCNAEDALGALEAEAATARLQALYGMGRANI